MTIHDPIDPDEGQAETFTTAREEIWLWHGKCFAHFTRVEISIAQCLAALADKGVKKSAANDATQRLDALLTLTADMPAVEQQRKSLRKSLAAWRELRDFRNALAHGHLVPTLNAKGDLHLILLRTIAQGDSYQFQKQVLDARDREHQLRKIRSRADSAIKRIDNFRAALSDTRRESPRNSQTEVN